MNRTKIVFVTVILCALSAASANIFWNNPDGTADYFDWTNGQSLYGLFGDPMLVGGNTFVFFPSNFRAESSDAQSSTVSDRLEFELIAHQGFGFHGISITEYGDYGILGHGSVNASGMLSAKNLDTAEVLSETLSTTPSMPARMGQGEWEGWSQVSIGPAGWTRIKITLENDLFAIAGYGATAFIEKKVLGSAVAIQIIPEPATAAILTIGSLLMYCNHRGKNKRNKT